MICIILPSPSRRLLVSETGQLRFQKNVYRTSAFRLPRSSVVNEILSILQTSTRDNVCSVSGTKITERFIKIFVPSSTEHFSPRGNAERITPWNVASGIIWMRINYRGFDVAARRTRITVPNHV